MGVLNWLLNGKSKWTQEAKKEASNRIKSHFQLYWNGGYGVQAHTKFNLSALEITNLQFGFPKDDQVSLMVTLGRPGLLIGKGGRTIKAMEDYLSNIHESETHKYNVKILITESKLWNRV